MDKLLFYMGNNFYMIVLARLALACILGGIIGSERESMSRPAGFRTHILVCVGSSLVMITSQYIFNEYKGLTNLDPSRLGAQVISGIGFLGAGTIIREGASVRGLTTAASLWAVSCVGIAAGIGFYQGAIFTTAIIFITLILLKKLEKHFIKKSQLKVFYIETQNVTGQIGHVSNVFYNYNASIRNIEFINDQKENNVLIKILVKIPSSTKKEQIFSDLQTLVGIIKVYED